MAAKKKRLSGSAAMAQAGKKPMLLWLTPEELDQARRAAEIERRPMTQLALYYFLDAVKKILKNSAESS